MPAGRQASDDACVSARVPPSDERAETRLSPGVELGWYVVAAVTYIAAGSVHKALLTWLVGPAWVVATLWFGPVVLDAALGALGVRRRGSP
jgi:hypothetical protein